MTLDLHHPQLATGAVLDAERTRAIIQSYEPIDPISAQYKTAFLDLIDRYPTLHANRFNYHAGLPGHLTAQAFVHHPGSNAIALMHHKKLDIWIGQGGHPEPGDDDLIATAFREATEEGGFNGLHLVQPQPIDLDIHDFPAKGDQPHHAHFDARFLFTTDDDQFHLNKAEGLAMKWCKIADLRDVMGMDPKNERLIRHLEARFGL